MAKKEKILVVGTGTMGEGIAQTFAQNGFDVRLVARRDEPLARALGQIKQNIAQFIEFGLITEPADAVLARIEGRPALWPPNGPSTESPATQWPRPSS